jgi:replicative DNA helicase
VIRTDLLTSEHALICAAMADPELCRASTLGPDDFGDAKCRAAWAACRDLSAEPFVDPWMLGDHLEFEGAARWAVDVLESAPNARLNWGYHERRIREEARTRHLRAVLRDSAGILDGGGDPSAIASRISAAISTEGTDEPLTMNDVLRMADEDRINPRSVVPTGIGWLDSKLSPGLYPGVTVIAGRTSHGKSTFAQILAVSVLQQGRGVHYFGFEDGAEVFGRRLRRQLGEGATGFDRFIFEPRPYTAQQIAGRVARYRDRNETAVVVIDYLQLMPRPCKQPRHEEIDDICTQLQAASVSQGLAYVLIAQCNRSFAGRVEKRPQLSDLRDSGAIEERAVAVMFVHCPRRDVAEDKQETERISLILDKNKNGPCGSASFGLDFERFKLMGG